MQLFLLILFATFQNYNYKLTGLRKPPKIIMTVIMKKKSSLTPALLKHFTLLKALKKEMIYNL